MFATLPSKALSPTAIVEVDGFGGDGGGLFSVDSASTPEASSSLSPPASVARYSVAVADYEDAAAARRVADEIGARMEHAWVAVVPVNGPGNLFHRVLVGLEEDVLDAEAFKMTMGQSLGRAPGGWVVQDAGRAFLLSESPSRIETDQTAADANALGIPAYVFRVPASDGTDLFRAYAGAYGDEAEAAYLSGVLQQLGFTPHLSERVGTLAR